jgi:lipopolysaccharide export system protein LptA
MPHSSPDNRHRRNLLRGLIAACALLGLAGQAADSKQEPIDVSGDAPQYKAGTFSITNLKLRQGTGTAINAKDATAKNIAEGYGNATWILKNAVHVEYEGAVLDADAAVVVFANDRLKSIEIDGGPAKFAHQSAPDLRRQGSARNIKYDTTGGKVNFDGDSWFFDGKDAEMRTNHVTYDTKDGSYSSPDKNARLTLKTPARVPAPRTPDRATAK